MTVRGIVRGCWLAAFCTLVCLIFLGVPSFPGKPWTLSADESQSRDLDSTQVASFRIPGAQVGTAARLQVSTSY